MKVLDDPSVSGRNEEMTSLLTALTGLRKGDASVRLPLDWTGVAGKVADAFNDVVEQNAAWPTSWPGCARWSARRASSSSARRCATRAASGASRSSASTR